MEGGSDAQPPQQRMTSEMLASLLKAARDLWDGLRHDSLSHRWRADLLCCLYPVLQRIQPELAGAVARKMSEGSPQDCLARLLDQGAFLAAIQAAVQELNGSNGASALQGMPYTAVPPAGLLSDLPLTMDVLSSTPPGQAKQMIGERLFPLVSQAQPQLAGKITGMLLEMDNPELLELLSDPFEILKRTAQAVHVLLIEGAVPPDARLQGFDKAAEQLLPASQRPLVCESWVLAAMPREERERFMEQRLFAAVAQLQPLAPWLLVHLLAIELDLQQCMLLRTCYTSATTAIRYLDQPLELAAAVNRHMYKTANGIMAERLSAGMPPGHALRTEAEVLEAAARLPSEGDSLPWSPASHGRFPAAFRSAAQALLLCKRRARALVASAAEATATASAEGEWDGSAGAGNSTGGQGTPPPAAPAAAAALDTLPDELMQPILSRAAHPLDAWFSAHV